MRPGEGMPFFPLAIRLRDVNLFGMDHRLHQSGTHGFQGFAALLNEAGSPANSGYRLRGQSRGPHLAVIGPAALIDAVFDRLIAIPCLPEMRGLISLRRLEDDAAAVPDWLTVIYDDVLELEMDDPDLDVMAQLCSLKVLRQCTRLGMFSEREPESSHPVA